MNVIATRASAAVLVTAVLLATSCDRGPSSADQTAESDRTAVLNGALGAVPHGPLKPGKPIDVLEAGSYILTNGPLLALAGYVNTNLLTLPLPTTCKLKLTSPKNRSRLSQELPDAVEMSVAVVLTYASDPTVTAFAGLSSGFFLTESGALVTSRHVLFEPTNIVGACVMTRDGQFRRVRQVLAADPTNDVVILQVEGQGFTPLPIATEAARKGSAVWVLSHPEWRFYILTSGIVAGYINWPDWNRSTNVHPTWLATTADFTTCSSGAPVLNENGEVVGVASKIEGFSADFGESGRGTAMVLKLCVPSSALLNMIKQE